MRKLVNFILFVAAAVGISWFMREYLVPQPESPTSSPPPFRPAPEPRTQPEPIDPPEQSQPASNVEPEDDLTRVTGIGPVFAKRLAAAGFASFADLAAANAGELADKVDVAESKVTDWITQAADLT
ncbi:MAG: hypothetical protein GXP36_03665 [Actinobacteria bacterium]|nr:hypothetical protein [Actinomycetota bacterium]